MAAEKTSGEEPFAVTETQGVGPAIRKPKEGRIAEAPCNGAGLAEVLMVCDRTLCGVGTRAAGFVGRSQFAVG